MILVSEKEPGSDVSHTCYPLTSHLVTSPGYEVVQCTARWCCCEAPSARKCLVCCEYCLRVSLVSCVSNVSWVKANELSKPPLLLSCGQEAASQRHLASYRVLWCIASSVCIYLIVTYKKRAMLVLSCLQIYYYPVCF